MIPKSASKIGAIRFTGSDVKNTLWTGRVAGVLKVWQVVDGRRPKSVSGRRLEQLLDELDDDLNEGRCRWVGERNDAALDGLVRAVRGL